MILLLHIIDIVLLRGSNNFRMRTGMTVGVHASTYWYWYLH